LREVTKDDIVAAVGRNGVNEINPNLILAACHIAEDYAEEAFKPLIFQVSERAHYLMNRQAWVAPRILEKRGLIHKDSYFFHSFVRKIFMEFVDTMVSQFKNVCLQEFYSPVTLYWDFYLDPVLKSKSKNVADLAKEIFEVIKERITRKIVLMTCNYFIFSITEKLYGWNEIQLQIHSLSDQELLNLFQIAQKSTLLQAEEAQLQRALKTCEDQEILLYGGPMFDTNTLIF